MSDLFAALGLLLAIEGLLFAGFPGGRDGRAKTSWRRPKTRFA
ncbi:hypothetical protein [Chenggangzhangella methanolivorans]